MLHAYSTLAKGPRQGRKENHLGVGEDLGHVYGYSDLSHVQVGVGRYHGAARVVDALAGQVAAKSPLCVWIRV